MEESGACMVNRRVTAQTLLCAHWLVCLQQFNRLIHFIFTEKHCIQSAAVVPLQSWNSKFTECCVHLIYILNASFVSMCAPCKNAACMCVSAFTSDWICRRVFLSVFILLCCSYARMIDTVLYHCYFYYTDEIFMSIASNITFFSIHPFCLYFF